MQARAANNPLVSIVIPCYNAERWISHAILSCLEQTYRPIEIIVIDDGSTDRSLDIIKSYSRVITWETGPNRGGNVARNRGLALAQGKYIQFLDADDYLLPHKIKRQVDFLEQTGADGVWCDKIFRPRYTGKVLPDRMVSLAPPTAPLLHALLAGFVIQTSQLLFRTATVRQVNGWDERLRRAQELDLEIRLALMGADLRYQPSFEVVIIQHDNSLSAASHQGAFTSREQVLEHTIVSLTQQGQLTSAYRRALSEGFYRMARLHSHRFNNPQEFRRLMHRAWSLDPQFTPQHAVVFPEKRIYIWLSSIVGVLMAEHITSTLRQWLGRGGEGESNSRIY